MCCLATTMSPPILFRTSCKQYKRFEQQIQWHLHHCLTLEYNCIRCLCMRKCFLQSPITKQSSDGLQTTPHVNRFFSSCCCNSFNFRVACISSRRSTSTRHCVSSFARQSLIARTWNQTYCKLGLVEMAFGFSCRETAKNAIEQLPDSQT